jgi:hypothetical protein
LLPRECRLLFLPQHYLSQHPGINQRGPGTSQGQTLSFGSSGSDDDLSDWYLSVFGAANVNSAITDGSSTTPGGVSEVTCND